MPTSKKVTEERNKMMQAHKQDVLLKHEGFAKHMASFPGLSDFLSNPLNTAILIDNIYYHCDSGRYHYKDDGISPEARVVDVLQWVEGVGVELEVTFSPHTGFNDAGELIRGRRIHLDELVLRKPAKLYVYTFDGAMLVGFTSDDKEYTGGESR